MYIYYTPVYNIYIFNIYIYIHEIIRVYMINVGYTYMIYVIINIYIYIYYIIYIFCIEYNWI